MNISDRTLNALQGKTFACQQSENAALVYTINWAAVLQAGTIANSEWAVTSGTATIASEANTDTTASAKLSGVPGRHIITNKITTAAGEVDERHISLTITGERTEGDYE